MAKCKLELRAVVPTAYTLRVVETGGGTATVTVLAADNNGYYLTSSVGTNSGLLATIAAALNADATLLATYALVLDDDTDASPGKVTLSASGGGVTAIAITWSNTPFGTTIQGWLGWSTNLSGSLSYTSDGQATHLWLPNVGRDGDAEGPDPSSTTSPFGRDEFDYQVTVAPAGGAAGMTRTVFNRRSTGEMSLTLIEGNKASIGNEVVVNESLQRFLRQCMTNGGTPFRYHPDRSSNTIYWTCAFGEDAASFAPVCITPGVTGPYSHWRWRALVHDAR